MKNIIKRILIGVAIGTILMFIRQNVYAYEWTTEGDELQTITEPSVRMYYTTGNQSSEPSYPFTASMSIVDPITNGNNGSITHKMQGYFVNGFTVSIRSELEAGTYYLILGGGYKSQNFSGDDTINESYLLDSSSYSVNESNFTIDSVSFSRGTSNEFVTNSSSYPDMLYFKVLFTLSEDYSSTTDGPIIFTLGNVSTSSDKLVFTSYGVTSNNHWLYRFNNSCTSWDSSGSCGTSYYKFYNPQLYSHDYGSIIPDGNAGLSGVTDDIKNQINNIVNGEFSDDLSFPHVFDGSGLSFGDYTFQDLLLMPLNWLKTIFTTTDTCTGVTLPFPGVANHTFVLPCASSFVIAFLGENLFFLLQLFISCTLGFKILYSLWKSCLHIFSPDHFIWVDDIF